MSKPDFEKMAGEWCDRNWPEKLYPNDLGDDFWAGLAQHAYAQGLERALEIGVEQLGDSYHTMITIGREARQAKEEQ